MVGKAPSEGTKVTIGQNAPVIREGAGTVFKDSLAAESIQAGGKFASNHNIHTSSVPGSEYYSSSPGGRGKHNEQKTTGGEEEEKQGQAAPTYVNNQFYRDPNGPHGKNITEDPEMTGRPGKFNVEVGSREDPSRVAEQQMRMKQAHLGGGGVGREVGVDEQPFSALDRETFA